MIYEIELPYPPTVNHYYQYVVMKGRNRHSKSAVKVSITEKGTKYRELVARAVLERGLPTIKGAIALKMYIYTPDQRPRDIDNVCKALYDAITKAGLWLDDSYVVFTQNYKYVDPDGVGKVILKIRKVEDVLIKPAGAWLKGERSKKSGQNKNAKQSSANCNTKTQRK